jgi:hypothetical protein
MNRANTHRRLRITLLVLLVVVVVAGGVTIYLHFAARAKFAEVKQIVEQLQVPADAVPLSETGIGDGLETYTCIDTSCPTYGRAYAVSVVPGSEMAVARQVLEAAGYRVTSSTDAACVRQGDWRPLCSVESVTGDVLVTVGIEFPTDQRRDWVPQQPPSSGTEWRRLTVGASDY